MLMTRCPHCGTAFRVKPEQLRARGGRVRCGHCQAPFSALESLIDTPPTEAVVPDEAPQAPAPAVATEKPAVVESPLAPMPPMVTAKPPAATPAFAVQSAMAGHRTSTWNSQSTSELAPPIPELDPSAPAKPTYSLDFDLDADDLPPAPAHAPAPVAPSANDFVQPSRSDEQTALTFDWRMAGDIPGGHGGAPSAHEAEVDLNASDWHGAPQEHRSADEVIEEPLETEEHKDEAGEQAPVFVTAYASPTGVSHEPLWATDDTPFEPVEADRFSPLPEQPATSSAIIGVDDDTNPDEPELVEHETAAFEPEAPEHQTVDAQTFAWDKTHEHEPTRWPWALAVAALFLLALAQTLLWARHDIAREFPATRPLFDVACAQMGCAMPWPRISAQISIDASDLHPRPDKDGEFELSGTLHNKAPFDQAYPHLEVTLTDVFNRALVRRALPPEVWLPPNLKGTSAFAAGGDIAFTIYLDASSQSATGYKLYAFYP